MIMSDDSSQPTLRCPSSTHWVSFRLLNENGDGDSFAGLNFFIQDSQGQIHAGTLDATGFSGKLDIYCGPSILSFATNSDTTDVWYKELLTRDSFPLPITSLQISAEQTPTGPRQTNGKM